MNRLTTLVIAALFAVLTACPGDGGGSGSAPQLPTSKPLTFTHPVSQAGGDAGLDTGVPGTVAGGGSEDPNIDVNIPPPGLTLEKCVAAKKAGEQMPVGCDSLVGAAASAAAKSMSESMTAAAAAVSSAMSGFKMPTISLGGFGAGGDPVKLPDGCHQDGDVSLAIADDNLRAAVRSVVNKGTSSTQVTAYDALKLTWLEIPNKDGKDINSLEGLRCFINLQLLDVSGHPISSLTPISTLSKLVVLKISKTKVSDLAPLAKLPIVYLFMDGVIEVKDLNPLFEIETLKGELISAMDNPNLPLCQALKLSKESKIEQFDVYCPKDAPNASGCGPCGGDGGYECNTQVENKKVTTVLFNQFTPCEDDKMVGLEVEVVPKGSATLSVETNLNHPSIMPISVSDGNPANIKVSLTAPTAIKQVNPLVIEFKSSEPITISTLRVRAILTLQDGSPEESVLLREVCWNQIVNAQLSTYQIPLNASWGTVVG